MNHNLSALVFQECCHTRQKWNLWVCGFVSVCCVCISKHVPICVFSYPHLCRRHTAAPLTPASLFVLQFSLIFFLCGRHVQFRVVTHTHIFVITLGLKVKCTHFHIHTRAAQHVLNLFCARTVLCPFVIVSTFAWEGTSVKFYIVTDIFAVSRCDWESKVLFWFVFLSVCLSITWEMLSCVFMVHREKHVHLPVSVREWRQWEPILSATVFHTSHRLKEKISSLRNCNTKVTPWQLIEIFSMNVCCQCLLETTWDVTWFGVWQSFVKCQAKFNWSNNTYAHWI